MMQRTVGMYIANKIKDEILNPPTPASHVDDEIDDVEEVRDDLDGQTIANAEGQVLGVAHRVRSVPVYVVGNGNNPNTDLDRALHDPDAEIIVHREGRTLTAVIYVPSASARLPEGPTRGFRADEV